MSILLWHRHRADGHGLEAHATRMSTFSLDATLARLFAAVGRRRSEGRLTLFQKIAVTHNSFADRSRELFPVIFAPQFADFILVRQKTAFDQHGRMSDIRDDEIL